MSLLNIETKATDQQKVVVLRLSTKVFEYGLLPVALHMIPVVNHTMADGIVDTICLGISKRFISDVKIEVLNSTFRSKVAWFGG